MNAIELEIKNDIFELAEDVMRDGIIALEKIGIPRKEITIYIPLYFNKMYCRYLMEKHIRISDYITEYHGIKVVNGYENKVIISCEYNLVYDIKPIIMIIP